MKTLIITADYPLPEDRGNRMRTMHFARFFGAYGDVDLMCYKSHVPKEKISNSFRKEFHIEFIKGENNGSNVLWSLYDKFVNCKPWIVNNYTDSSIKYVHSVIAIEDYDIIVCRYSINAFPLLTLPLKYKQRVLLDVDDLMSGDLYDALNGEKNGITRIKAIIDKKVFARYQIRCLELGKILFCSEADKLKMVKYGNSENMHVVPNIIPNQTIPESYKRDGHDNEYLLFIGNLSYKPNEMGIMWFISEVFERLPEKLQNFKLLVAGKNPQDALKKLCSQNSRIELVENPPDVVPYFEKSMAVIVPVLVGGGTRIKILEAGNCRRPVISTRLGAYGLKLNEYAEVLYFDNCDSFKEKLLWLNNRDNYLKLVDNLKSKIETDYSEKAFNKTVRKILY